jgi:hypothetical protein
MKRYILIPALFFATLITVEAATLKKEIPGTWNVQKVETTDPSINFMIQDYDFSKLSVEFTKSGVVLLSGKATGSQYRVTGNKIVVSGGAIKDPPQAEVKADITSGVLTMNLPADMVKQILLTFKEQYLKSGGETFIARMIEGAANANSIEAVITLKRK